MSKRLLWMLGIGLVAVSALAAAIHFIQASANIDKSGDLVISWKEAGLGKDTSVSYYASANGSAVYACINHGGKHAQAASMTTSEGPVSGSGSFSAGHNGQITASLTLTPPDPPASFSCPNGQLLVIASVTYTDATLTDTTNSITPTLTGNCASATGCTDVLYNLQP